MYMTKFLLNCVFSEEQVVFSTRILDINIGKN